MRYAVIVVFALFPGIAWAHDPERPNLDNWFGALHSAKGPCCSDADKALVNDADWETIKGPDGIAHYRVRIEGEWVDVPDDAVIKVPNLYGPTVVWGYRNWGYTGEGHYQDHVSYVIRCFMPGVMM